ncbi:MAG: hypothetical protein PHX54_06135 [Lentimicrobiaceae bacterium]|nr:hypothetical protein [Lentimicrobiaceae bacterium]
MNEESTERKLKFVLMCNGPELQQWQQEALNKLLNEGHASLQLIVMKTEEPMPQQGLVKKLISYPWNRLFFNKYYQYFFRASALKTVSIDEHLKYAAVLRCGVLKKGKYSEYFSDSDIEIIKSFRPDFILKFGFGILRGKILEAAPYGIWSFHHGDEQKFRGVPPAFYEILKKEQVTASILQQLTEKLDGGIILRKGYFPTISHSWKANLEQALKFSVNWPADVCRELALNGNLNRDMAGATTSAPVYKVPGNITMLKFMLRSLYNRVYFHLFEIFRAETWQTGLIQFPAASWPVTAKIIIDPREVKWLKAGKRRKYFADGFSTELYDRLLLLYEDYCYSVRKASIAASWFHLTEKNFSKTFTALSESWHLSYPFLFTHKKKTYCIPESLSHGSIELYELDTHSGQLKYVRPLVEGLAAADPSLLCYEDRWYLFFTPPHATNTELQLWHADTLDGPFVPHVLSPVKADVRNARPAGGFITQGDKLYRPAQDCSQTYGGRVILNEITALSATQFSETAVAVVEPPKGYRGLHTLSFAGNYLYFDVKNFTFVPSATLFQLFKRLGIAKSAKSNSGYDK